MLVVAGGAVGVVLGFVAGVVTRLRHRNGTVVGTAGAAFATLWIDTVAGRSTIMPGQAH